MFTGLINAVRLQQLREKRREACCRAPWNVARADSGRRNVLLEICTVCHRKHTIEFVDPVTLTGRSHTQEAGAHGRV